MYKRPPVRLHVCFGRVIIGVQGSDCTFEWLQLKVASQPRSRNSCAFGSDHELWSSGTIRDTVSDVHHEQQP